LEFLNRAKAKLGRNHVAAALKDENSACLLVVKHEPTVRQFNVTNPPLIFH
jgi:hypothetical protein